MKKMKLLFVFLTFLGVKTSFGQVYEKVYSLSGPEVQNHMNQNKIQAIDILTGVKAHHVVGISGLTLSQKSDLESLLQSNLLIENFIVSEDVKSVSLTSKATFSEEDIKTLLNQLNCSVIGYSISYSVSN